MEFDRRHFLGLTVAVGMSGGGWSLAHAQTGTSELLAKARASGTLRVGCSGHEPSSIVTPDKFTGESLESAHLVLKGLGIQTLEPVVMQFGGLIPALQAGRIDMIAQSMSITPVRCEQVSFSDPYYAKLTNLMVKKGSNLGLKRFEDIAKDRKIRFGYTLGGTEGPQAKAAGVADEQISTFPSPPALIDALRAGRIDVLALPDTQVNWRLSKGGWEAQELETPGSFVPVVDGKEQLTYTAFGFRRSDAAFRDEFNDELARKRKDGSLLDVVTRFGVTKQGYDLAQSRTAAELCRA